MTTVAFIGLGIMGGPMAANLVEAGFDVVGYNRTPDKVERADRGRRPRRRHRRRGGPRGRRDHHDRAGLPGRRGGRRRRRRRLRQRHARARSSSTSRSAPTSPARWPSQAASAALRVLDAPVSGGEAGAIEASLSIMVGGEAADFEAARPVLEAVGKTIVHVGPTGSGPDRQGRQPAHRRRQHRAARRGDRLPGGLRRRHRGRAGGARRRPGRQHGAGPQGRRTCSPASSSPASGSPCTTRTWAS